MTKAIDLAKKLREERLGLKAFLDEHTKDGDLKLEPDDRTRFTNWNKSLADLNDEYEQAKTDEDAIAANETGLKSLSKPVHGMVFNGDQDPADDGKGKDELGPLRFGIKSLGELFVESDAYTGWNKSMAFGPVAEVDLEKVYGKGAMRYGLKLFDTSSWAPQSLRLPQVITPGEQGPTVADLMPQGQTGSPVIPYMEETTTDNQAGPVAESGEKLESDIGLEEKQSTVRKLATSLKTTDEALEDVPTAQSYVEGRLTAFLQQEEDNQLLNGPGSGNNLRGIMNTSGVTTQGMGSDEVLDALFKAAQKVYTESFLQATGMVVNPTDWATIRLAKADTAGTYQLGAATSDPNAVRPWGLQVVQTTRQLAGTVLVGAFRLGAQVFRRSGISLQIGFINDQFIKNQRTIIIEERLALVVFRPNAFCKLDLSS